MPGFYPLIQSYYYDSRSKTRSHTMSSHSHTCTRTYFMHACSVLCHIVQTLTTVQTLLAKTMELVSISLIVMSATARMASQGPTANTVSTAAGQIVHISIFLMIVRLIGMNVILKWYLCHLTFLWEGGWATFLFVNGPYTS